MKFALHTHRPLRQTLPRPDQSPDHQEYDDDSRQDGESVRRNPTAVVVAGIQEAVGVEALRGVGYVRES